ncbi:MAG: hypothetical protein OXT74_02995, partial [Candidatus Poribacteria bacterium]|nr:hypothetical protein [Candidatus Poribacteria bacterium]
MFHEYRKSTPAVPEEFGSCGPGGSAAGLVGRSHTGDAAFRLESTGDRFGDARLRSRRDGGDDPRGELRTRGGSGAG